MIRKRLKYGALPEPDFLPNKAQVKADSVFARKYTSLHPRQAYFLTLMGFTIEQMAQVFGMGTAVINQWMKTKPEFFTAVMHGRELADGRVAHSLFSRACGYSHPDEVILTNRIREYDKDGKIVSEHTEPLRVPVTKRYPPDTAAAVKWLKARQPEVWGTRVEVKGKITMHHEIDLSKFSNEELEVLNKLSLEKGNMEEIDYEEVKT